MSARLAQLHKQLTHNMPFDTVPSNASLKPSKFTAQVSDQDLNDFKQLLKLSKIGPETYENLREDRYFGVNRQWLKEAKQHWETSYDWRKTESRINALPQFHVKIEDIDVHFMALFSKKPDAAPIALLHGWPGTWTTQAATKLTAQDLSLSLSRPPKF